ncbi:MAG: hypothetical protein JJ978_17630 [Roseivirga sp.]|jgi:hypothetical protein|uniref:hypothetical protein n=1 Tax=Roseivirga sp. TaxID=1964215 RepID=UPI001B08EAA4|nr:hypothetical protein [Roseivirga sp.]MBO6497391.1 hypothetical protein [Roseivirga sp.]
MKNRNRLKQSTQAVFSVAMLMLISLNLSAQGIVEGGLFQHYYRMNQEKLEEMKELKRLAWSEYSELVDVSQVKAEGKYLAAQKSKKKYDELTFTLGGRKLVTSGKVYFSKSTVERNGYYVPKIGGVSIVPNSDIRYQGSGKLFASIDDIEGSIIKPSGNLYNEDGTIFYSEELDETGQYIYRTATKPNGDYDFMLYSPNGSQRDKADKFGTYSPNMVYPFSAGGTQYISPEAREISLINFENGDKYIGFSTAGTYDTRGSGTFTGYMPTLFMEYGNGGVFFLERPWAEQLYSWALVVDGEVEMTIPADISEKPQVDSLLNNLEVNMSYYPYPTYMLDEKEKKDAIWWPTMSGQMLSKDTANLNGYGIKFHTADSAFRGDHSYLEVGTFQNGKLHGMGYRVNITRLYNNKFSSRPKNETEDYDAFAARVKGAAGVFNNGELVDGRVLDIDNARKTYKNGNRWKHIPVEGFAFIGNVPLSFKGSLYYGDMPYTDLPKDKANVYVSEIQRIIKVLEIDTTRKAIKVMGDYDEPVWLDENSGPLYWLYSANTATTSFCPRTITRKKFKEINVKKSIPRNTTTVRKVNGAIVDYYYTTRKSDPIEYTVKETVLDGYETVTCPVCHGEGIVSVKALASQYKQLVFH